MSITKDNTILASDLTTILDTKQDKLTYTPVKSVNGTEADDSGNIIIASTERFTFPDYSAGVTKSWNTQYTAEVDGWLYVKGNDANTATSDPYFIIEGQNFLLAYVTAYNVSSSLFVPVSSGQTYKGEGGNTQVLTFYPCI